MLILLSNIFGLSAFTRLCSNILQMCWKYVQCINSREFYYQSTGEKYLKISPHCQSYYQRTRDILFWDTVYNKLTNIGCRQTNQQQFFACCDHYRFIVSITSSQCPHVRDTGKHKMSWCSDVVRSDLHLGELQRVTVAFPVIPQQASPALVSRTEQIQTSQDGICTRSIMKPPSAN